MSTPTNLLQNPTYFVVPFIRKLIKMTRFRVVNKYVIRFQNKPFADKGCKQAELEDTQRMENWSGGLSPASNPPNENNNNHIDEDSSKRWMQPLVLHPRRAIKYGWTISWVRCPLNEDISFHRFATHSSRFPSISLFFSLYLQKNRFTTWTCFLVLLLS